MILFDLQMILVCQLFYLNHHFFLLLFWVDLLFRHHLHTYNHHPHLYFHFHNPHLHFYIHFLLFYFLLFCFLLFYFLLFHFLDFLMFCQLKLYLINHQINFIIFYVQGYTFYTLLFLHFLFCLIYLNLF